LTSQQAMQLLSTLIFYHGSEGAFYPNAMILEAMKCIEPKLIEAIDGMRYRSTEMKDRLVIATFLRDWADGIIAETKIS
jgi:hypothetical protein